MKYVALQVKTSYSILTSLNNIKKLVSYAKNIGYTSLAITDTNNMFGVPEFYYECKKNNIKPIIGIELTINDKNILLYASNNNGYKNLIVLLLLGDVYFDAYLVHILLKFFVLLSYINSLSIYNHFFLYKIH